jgi:hypothetical protein
LLVMLSDDTTLSFTPLLWFAHKIQKYLH